MPTSTAANINFYEAFLNLIGNDMQIVIMTIFNFILGFIGAWANFFLEQIKMKVDITFKLYLSKIVFLFSLCFLGGIVGVLIAQPGGYLKAFIAGFGALSILEQVATGEKGKILVAGYSNNLTDTALSEFNSLLKNMDKEVNKLKEKFSKDEGGGNG